MTAWLLSILGYVIGVLAVFWAGGRNARLKADVAAARANLRRVQTREQIEDEIQDDTDLVDRAKRVGLVRPE